jgi:hypothetical protein
LTADESWGKFWLVTRMNRGRKILIGALVCLLASFGACLNVVARQQPSVRVVDYVSPSLVSSDPKPQVVPIAQTKPNERDIVATPPRKSTEGDRWEAFEREYGVHQKNPSWFLSMLQSAKYGLDKLTFGAKETARRMEFTYDIGSADGPSGRSSKPQYSLPLFGAFGHAQLKTVLTEHDPQTATPFVGLKFSVPFGENE